eukprot:2124410-Pleurochrysis_carterae.AAC.5
MYQLSRRVSDCRPECECESRNDGERETECHQHGMASTVEGVVVHMHGRSVSTCTQSRQPCS